MNLATLYEEKLNKNILMPKVLSIVDKKTFIMNKLRPKYLVSAIVSGITKLLVFILTQYESFSPFLVRETFKNTYETCNVLVSVLHLLLVVV